MAAFCGAGLLVSGALVVYGSGRGALYGGIGTMTAVAYFSAVTIWPDEGLPLSRVPTDGGVLQDMHVFASLATGLWGGPIAEFVAARIGGSSRTIQGLRALVTIAILAATTRVGGVYGLALAAVGAGATTLLATVGDFSALQCRALGRILMPVATVTVLAATFVPGAADISDGRFVAGALTGAVLAELVRRAHRLGPMRFSIMWLGTPMALWGLLGAPAVVGSVLGVWLDASMQAEVDDGLDLSLWWSMLALAMAPLFL
jgi:hypothetical protein